jgi:hypothetical protein
MQQPEEIEAKYRLDGPADHARLRARLAALGAQPGGRVAERNLLFDQPDRALQAAGRVLRLRVLDGGPGARLTFKGPAAHADGLKRRVELETPVTDAAATRAILEALGYQPTLEYAWSARPGGSTARRWLSTRWTSAATARSRARPRRSPASRQRWRSRPPPSSPPATRHSRRATARAGWPDCSTVTDGANVTGRAVALPRGPAGPRGPSRRWRSGEIERRASLRRCIGLLPARDSPERSLGRDDHRRRPRDGTGAPWSRLAGARSR